MTDYTRLFRVDGKVALVTGAARGIGAAIAEALAQVGATVLVTDVLESAGLETVERIRKAGGKAEFQKHDVTDEAQWEAAVAAATGKLGGLDILVNNAGIETAALITQCKVEDFRHLMDINVTGVFLGLKHAIGVMKPGASIVNLSSVAGLIGTSAHVAYHASKGAVRIMTKAAAVECAQLGTGIRVNSIHPAIVQTDMGTKFIQDFVNLKLAPDYASAEAAIKGAHPLGRFGEPADVAGAVIYLASEAAKWITGSELVLDGGYTAA
ncbi:glucose 1-dehydrogenase [Panacagrimonas sp.]|uniref:glucose 1-dehydrogenase n=1 Tax=Panacagrimonas sp. TaxID=2480088 RepID=UPI003B524FEF